MCDVIIKLERCMMSLLHSLGIFSNLPSVSKPAQRGLREGREPVPLLRREGAAHAVHDEAELDRRLGGFFRALTVRGRQEGRIFQPSYYFSIRASPRT